MPFLIIIVFAGCGVGLVLVGESVTYWNGVAACASTFGVSLVGLFISSAIVASVALATDTGHSRTGAFLALVAADGLADAGGLWIGSLILACEPSFGSLMMLVLPLLFSDVFLKRPWMSSKNPDLSVIADFQRRAGLIGTALALAAIAVVLGNT